MIALNQTDSIYQRTQNVPEKGQIIPKKVHYMFIIVMSFPC